MGVNVTLAPAEWRKMSARAVDNWILAADLGQSNDPTAICALNHRVLPLETWTKDVKRQLWKQDRTEHFDVRFLQRLPLGRPYPEYVQTIGQLLTRPPLDRAALVIDETGVGRAVGDMFEAAGLSPERVTITAGHEATRHGSRIWHVPKALLVSGLDARLHSGELQIAKALSESETLQEELQNFQRKVNEAGRASYNARNGAHDDLVLAVAIAVWFATNAPTSSQEPLGI